MSVTELLNSLQNNLCVVFLVGSKGVGIKI